MNRKEFIGKIIFVGVTVATVPVILVSSNKQVGKNFSTFVLEFPERYWEQHNIIVGPNNIPIHITKGPWMYNDKYQYMAQIFTGDPDLSIPEEYLKGEVEFKRDWSLVEQTLEKKRNE